MGGNLSRAASAPPGISWDLLSSMSHPGPLRAMIPTRLLRWVSMSRMERVEADFSSHGLGLGAPWRGDIAPKGI